MRSQIAAQERHNIDLVASNTSLRKTNIEFGEDKKDLSAKFVELKSKIEELDNNHVELVK